jgi:hypothetical protein
MQAAASSDGLTRFLATWGAIVSTAALSVTLYREWLDRAKLQICASVRRIAFSDDGKMVAAVAPDVNVEASEQLYVMMNVVNVGRRPIVWEGWGGKYHKREKSGNAFHIGGRNLPKKLLEGESHQEFAPLQSDLKPVSDNVKSLFVWNPAGTHWALSEKQLNELKEQARNAVGR